MSNERIDPLLNAIELRALLRGRARHIENLTDDLRVAQNQIDDLTHENGRLRKELDSWVNLPW